MAQWNALPGIQPPKPIRDFKGVNKQDPFFIFDGQASSSKNLTATAYPAMTVRPGTARLYAALNTIINGMGVWKDTQLHVIAGDKWYRDTGAAFAELASGLNEAARWSFCNFKGSFADYNLLAANGVDPVKKYDGNTVSNLANAPAGMKYIDAHDNRVYGAVGNFIKWCAIRKADDWSAVNNSGDMAIETNNGEDISALKAGPGHVVIFKPHSTHELFGTGPINFRRTDVSDKIGCVANDSALMVGGVLYFLGHDGVYKYTGGVAPEKDFSMVVQWYIDRINVQHRHKAVAGTDGKRYYLAIPFGASTEPDTVLEFDPEYDGIWNVWNLGENVTGFAYLKEKWYYGTQTGNVNLVGGTLDYGQPVAWEWESKPFGSGSFAAKKDWFSLWLVMDLPAGSTCDVYLSGKAEGQDWVLVKNLIANADIQSTQVLIPLGQVANKNWMRVKLVGTGPATIHELTYQERIMSMGV